MFKNAVSCFFSASQDVMDCHFNSEYACGYMDFGVTSLVWTRTNGLEVPDDGVAPVSDNTDSILGRRSHQQYNP